MNNLISRLLVFISIFIFSIDLYAVDEEIQKDTFYVDKIEVKGILLAENNEMISKIVLAYEKKNLTFTELKDIRSEVDDFYKAKGDLFVKVIIPEQDIAQGVFTLRVVKAKINKVTVVGNQYYSSKFIKNNFSLKEGDYLDYHKMIKSLTLLNEFSDLKVKASPKKGKEFGTTDIQLQVEDENPFHLSIVLDNLGSKDTAKNRVSTSLFYGNLLLDADEINLNYTLGFSNNLALEDTKLLQTGYGFVVGNYHTKMNVAALFANYIALGDFSVLNLEGDTKIYTLSITQPLSRSTKNQIDISLDYENKIIKNYILNALSSEDKLNEFTLSTTWRYTDIYNSLSSKVGLSYGGSADTAVSARANQDKSYSRLNFEEFYSRYINDTNNFLFSIKGQYSSNLLPIVDMYSIGGMDTIRGYEPSQQIGDSGFVSSVAWSYHPKIDYAWLKDAIEVGAFFDYGEVYVNSPVAGQESSASLMGTGVSFKANIKESFFANLVVGIPLNSSVEIKDKTTKIYFVLGAKLW